MSSTRTTPLSRESKGRVEVQRTHDVELVRRIHTHPRIYPWIVDDTCGPPESYDPSGVCLNRFIFVLVPTCDGAPMGTATFVPRSRVLYEVHSSFLPAYWGPLAGRGIRAALAWMFEHTAARKIEAVIPAVNRLACAFALRAGGEMEGVSRRSFLRGGQMIDQWLFGTWKE